MIKKLDANDISQILYLKDPDFTDLFQCEVVEWIQFLMQNKDTEHFFMIGSFDDEKLVGYLIAYFVPLPIFKGVSVLYSKTAGKENNKEALLKLIEWAKEKKAPTIDIITKNPSGHSVYGFKKSATMMSIEV
jgi:hypothetical protein